MAPAEPGGHVCVSVVYSPGPGKVDEERLWVPIGTTLRDVLLSCDLVRRHGEIDIATARVGIWGRFRALDELLRDQDRVEIYRPLRVDPKEARRLRYRKHRERTRS